MATESFTKRAAAELSRCFNGLNVNKNSPSTKKPAASANGTAAGQTILNNNTNHQQTTTANESNVKNDLIKNNKTETIKSTTNNLINSLNNTSGQPSSSTGASNLFTLTNSVKSIGSAYEQNILAAKTALRSPFKSPNKSSTIVSNVVNSFNGLDSTTSSDNLNNSNNKLISIASPQTPRKQGHPPKAPPKTNRARLRNYLLSLRLNKPNTIDELWRNEHFLVCLFKYFSPIEKCKLAQVSVLFFKKLKKN